MHKAAQAYFETQISTTSQGELLLMLYDGAIKFLNQAKVKIADKDFAAKGILISKAMDVISELDSSLNVNKGGELAEKMHNLYFYCNTRLLKANMDLDINLIDEVIKILGGIRSAYAQIIPTEAAMAASQSGQDSQAPAPGPKAAPKAESAPMNSPMDAPTPYGPRPAAKDPAAMPQPGAAAPVVPGPNAQAKRSGANAYSHIASNT